MLRSDFRWKMRTCAEWHVYCPAKLSVLIADDDESWRFTVRDVLEPVGYRTLMADSGWQALQTLKVEPVDCLLLDYQMPDLDGLATLRAVRQFLAALPCVFMTASVERDWLKQAQMLGCLEVLNKPATKESICRAVRLAIGIGSTERPFPASASTEIE